MNKLSLQEINDLIKKCKIKLESIDYCDEKENIQDGWNDTNFKTIEDVLDDYGIDDAYINSAYNEHRPNLDHLELIMGDGNDGVSSEDYFLVEMIIKNGFEGAGDIVAAYYVCD